MADEKNENVPASAQDDSTPSPEDAVEPHEVSTPSAERSSSEPNRQVDITLGKSILPPAAELERIEKLHSGVTERVLMHLESIRGHREKVDDDLVDLDREDMRRSHRQSEWALGIVAVLALTFLGSGVAVALRASPSAGVVLALGGVTITVGGAALFAIGTSKRKVVDSE